jgi:hypothetical protein
MGPEEASNKLNWPVPTLQLALQALALPRNLTLDISFTLREIAISRCPSRIMMCKSGSMDGFFA